jgi:hypothetical protein
MALFDMTHNFVLSYAYELPFGRLSSLPRRLRQGWSINGITRFTTGFPVLLSESGDRSLVGSTGIDFPNLIGPVSILNPRKAGPAGNNQYFSTTSFTAEALGSMGDANRAFFHGPGLNNWDFACIRTLQFAKACGFSSAPNSLTYSITPNSTTRAGTSLAARLVV